MASSLRSRHQPNNNNKRRSRQASPDNLSSKKPRNEIGGKLYVLTESNRYDNPEREKSSSSQFKEGVTSRPHPWTIDIFNIVQTAFPRQPLNISSWIPSFQSSLEEFCGMAYLVFPKDSPTVALYVFDWSAAEAGDAGREKAEDLGNDMTREVTSVLQGFMTSPICIVPVFLDRRDLEADRLQTKVTDTLKEVKSFIPYGRWLMTESKFQAMQKAIEDISQQLDVA